MITNLVGWHAGAVSFPLSDVILAQLVCPLSDLMFCLYSGITNLPFYKHCMNAYTVHRAMHSEPTMTYFVTPVNYSHNLFIALAPGRGTAQSKLLIFSEKNKYLVTIILRAVPV